MKNQKGTVRVDQADGADDLLKAEDVAKKLNLALPTIYQFAHRGLLPCVKLGRSVRFRPESLQRFLDNREKEMYAKAA